MGYVSPELYARWKSANQVGGAKPTLRVTVTRGTMDKTYDVFMFLDESKPGKDFMHIVEGNNFLPWQGEWRATGEPKELPNVLSAKWTQGFSQNGSRTATVEVENIIYKAITGVGGVYHAILRGYLSPWLGLQLIARAKLPDWVENEWFEVLDNGYKIDIYEGYGDQQSHTFSGLIEEADLEALPDRIIITARDYGIYFTDQRMMGFNKPPECIAPVTFADRDKTLGIEAVGANAKASSQSAGHPSGSVTSKGNRRAWLSSGHASAEATEWIEIDIPPGYYADIYTALPFKGQSLYLSIYAGAGSHYGSEEVTGWVDGGKGNVPGESYAYVNRWTNTSASGSKRSLGNGLQAHAGTKVRVSLTKLPLRPETRDHRAGVNRLAAFRFGPDANTPKKDPKRANRHWVLVDDLADIARVLFMWAGFKEWEVEDLGTSINNPLHYGMDKFFIDILNDIQTQANWLFYMQSPSVAGESLGVPTFKHNTALDEPPRSMLEVRDTDLLESVKAKIDLSNLPYIIRYRGNVDEKNGKVYDGDKVKRYNGTYFPPWSGAGPEITESGRNAGVRRHELTIDPNLQSDEECILAAILAAQQYGLGAYTAEVQIAGYPGVELNEQISVVDRTTAVNSRLWVASIQSEHTTGPSGSWKMTIGGSLVDGIDMQKIGQDLEIWQDIVRTLKAEKEELVGGVTA